MLSPLRGTPGRTPGRSRLGVPPPPPQRTADTGNGHRVRVVARVRPFLRVEVSTAGYEGHNCTCILKGDEEDSLRITTENASSQCGQGSSTRKPPIKLRISWLLKAKVCRSEEYKLDACYGESTGNAELFANEVQPILPYLLEGRNATVFAYGATGSGKTHTMQGTEKDPGLMLRAVRSLFSAATHPGCTVAVSYYEVYMDRCYDLLEMKNEVPVLEDQHGNIQFRGLAKMVIRSVDEFQSLLAEGCARRRVGSTALNDGSSRSHGVLAITVASIEEATNVRREAKLNLIDLAGNEDNRKTGSDGVRLAESSQINQSLFALSNVINALNANDARVPYRDSKLTRILRDSLGGTSRSVMVACLNPGSFPEAVKTLSLAARSRQVVNHAEGHKQSDELTREKVDMAAKLQAWKDSKTRTPAKNLNVSCSPSPLKPFLMRSPPTQARSPKTPASQKHPLERVSNRTRVKSSSKIAVSVTRTTTSKKTPVISPIRDEVEKACMGEDIEKKITATDVPRTFSEEMFNNCTNPLFQDGDAGSDVYDDEADKENNFLQLMGSPYTPLKAKTAPTVEASPPLSVKLKSLARALQPVSPLALSCVSPVEANGESPVMEKTPTTNSFSRVLNLEDFTPTLNGAETPTTNCLVRAPSLNDFTPSFNAGETPYERFSKSTAKIRSMLVEQYLDVLNSAPREQLLLLKGFGERRTEAILQLRETSPEPMKELADLERIGISSKQAYAIFNSNVIRQVSFAP